MVLRDKNPEFPKAAAPEAPKDILAEVKSTLALGKEAGSGRIEGLLEWVEAARAKAGADATALAADRTGLLVTADDAALEKHDAQQRKAEVLRDRLAASRAALEQQLEHAKAHEAAVAHAAKLALIKAMRDGVIADFEKYRECCRFLADFAERWGAVDDACVEVGIVSLTGEFRWKAGAKEPDRQETKEFWVTGNGDRAVFWDGVSPRPLDGVRLERETVTVEGAWRGAQNMPNLLRSMKLPALTLDDPIDYWPKY